MHSLGENLSELLYFHVIESVLFFPDQQSSLGIGVSTLTQLFPDFVYSTGFLLINVHARSHILFPGGEYRLLDTVIGNLCRNFIILVMCINWFQCIVIPSPQGVALIILAQLQENEGEGLELLLTLGIELAVQPHLIQCVLPTVVGAHIQEMDHDLRYDQFRLPIVLVVDVFSLLTHFTDEVVI